MRTHILLLIATIMLISGCSHKTVVPAQAVTTSRNSYLDLTSDWRLRILLPLAKEENSGVAANCVPGNGNAMVCSAPNLIGYQMSYYSVDPAGGGSVRLRFTSADITIDGKKEPGSSAVQLPFALPTGAAHIRLIYLIRVSRSDHNMAIVGAQNPDALNVFTDRLNSDPSVCGQDGEIFCTWVPEGIVLRPEAVSQPR
jgi:hypothetical protein